MLCVVDAVATIGGTDVNTDEWCLDAVVGGTQKCLSVPSGMAPITFNSRVEKRINERKKVERGIATREDIVLETGRLPISSNYFDLGMLMDYWSPRRLNHHTEATSMLYGLREGARVVLEEGLRERFSRHRLHETALIKGIKAMGLELFTEGRKKLPTVTCVKVPDRVDADLVRKMMLDDFGVEIARLFRAAGRKDMENRNDGIQLPERKCSFYIGCSRSCSHSHRCFSIAGKCASGGTGFLS